jgi:hypothetical protein
MTKKQKRSSRARMQNRTQYRHVPKDQMSSLDPLGTYGRALSFGNLMALAYRRALRSFGKADANPG